MQFLVSRLRNCFVDEQAWKADQALILVVEQQAQRVGQNVFEARPPAVPPDILER